MCGWWVSTRGGFFPTATLGRWYLYFVAGMGYTLAMNIGVYFDLENVKNFNLSDLMRALEHEEDGETNMVAVKLAVGDTTAINQYKEQLNNENFTIVAAPHLVAKKNRSDIMLSVQAYEDLNDHNPPIERFVFITSDSDFTFIMNKLKLRRKSVWLVCRGEDAERPYFKTCTDKCIPIEKKVKPKRSAEDLRAYLTANGFDDEDWHHLCTYFTNGDWKKCDLNFNYKDKGKKIKNLRTLLSKLVSEFYLEKSKKGNANVYRKCWL
jgi:hypothetical protein